jgi:sugar lactone lactonase YvrE
MSARGLRQIGAAAFTAAVLGGCTGGGTPQQTALPQTSGAASKLNICVDDAGAFARANLTAGSPRWASVRARPSEHGRELLYVLVQIGSPPTGSVVVYDAYASNPKVIRTVNNLGIEASSIWTDDDGNVYVGVSGQNALYSYVSVYAPGMTGKPIRTYRKGIALPFGGAVDANGTMYVSDGGLVGQTQGDVAVFPAGKLKPSQIKYYNVYVPHGLAVDAKRNIFISQVYGKLTFVTEFPHDAYEGKTLPLNDLSGGYLLGLVLDSDKDIIVADECNQAVRFYPPPYKDESKALTIGTITPDSVAYAPNGSLYVGNQFIANDGNVLVFPAGASTPSETITSGIDGQVFGVAVGRY